MKKIVLLAILSFGALLYFNKCDSTSVQDIKNIVFPDSNVSFSKQVLPIIQANCASSTCHGINAPTNVSPMYDYYTIMNLPENLGLVVRNNANASRLIMILEQKVPHNPNYTWQINLNQLDGIKTWIDEGAKNN